MKITVMDPVEFIQMRAARNTFDSTSKKQQYHLMLINAIDGLGKLDKRYGFL